MRPPRITLTYHAHAGDLERTRQNSFPGKHQPNNPAWRPGSSLGGPAPRSATLEKLCLKPAENNGLSNSGLWGSGRPWSAAASQAAEPAPARVLLIPRCGRRPWAIYTTRHHENPLKTNAQRNRNVESLSPPCYTRIESSMSSTVGRSPLRPTASRFIAQQNHFAPNDRTTALFFALCSPDSQCTARASRHRLHPTATGRL